MRKNCKNSIRRREQKIQFLVRWTIEWALRAEQKRNLDRGQLFFAQAGVHLLSTFPGLRVKFLRIVTALRVHRSPETEFRILNEEQKVANFFTF